MALDRCPLPVVLAPLAGGPSTPELCAAVSEAGGLGFLAAGYLSASELGGRLERTRALTGRPFGVNLFHPQPAAQPDVTESYANRLSEEVARGGVDLGGPGSDDDEWTAKVELLAGSPVDVVSVTFGCPSAAEMTRLRAAASEVWVTVTSVDEAHQARDAGADGLVVQGVEAGGHRGGFSDQTERL